MTSVVLAIGDSPALLRHLDSLITRFGKHANIVFALSLREHEADEEPFFAGRISPEFVWNARNLEELQVAEEALATLLKLQKVKLRTRSERGLSLSSPKSEIYGLVLIDDSSELRIFHAVQSIRSLLLNSHIFRLSVIFRSRYGWPPPDIRANVDFLYVPPRLIPELNRRVLSEDFLFTGEIPGDCLVKIENGTRGSGKPVIVRPAGDSTRVGEHCAEPPYPAAVRDWSPGRHRGFSLAFRQRVLLLLLARRFSAESPLFGLPLEPLHGIIVAVGRAEKQRCCLAVEMTKA